MVMLTVDDLARDLKVKNEDLIRHLATMGYEVDGPESPLETDDAEALRAELVTVLPKREVIEKRIKPTVIRRRVKKKPMAKQAEEPAKAEVAEEPLQEPPKEAKEKPPTAEKKAAAKPKAAKKAARKKPEPAKILEKPSKSQLKAVPEEKKPTAPEKEPGTKPAKSPAKLKEMVLPEVQTDKPQPKVALKPKKQVDTSDSPEAAEAPKLKEPDVVTAPEPEVPEAVTEAAAEKPAKKKKRKEKRVQPAQIIGRVELKREPEPETETETETETIRRPSRERARPMRPVEHTPDPMPPQPVQEEDKRSKKKKDKKRRDAYDNGLDKEGGRVRRRKEVLLRQDLYGEHPRGGRLRHKGKKTKQRKTPITVPKASKRRIKLPDIVTVADLAHRLSIKAAEVIQFLLSQGVTATMNEGVDFDTAALVASEFGFEAETAEHTEKDFLPEKAADTEEDLVLRPPVVTMMGHVDHGKTSLLDYIRATHVTDSEAGGITQHIGAYKVRIDKGELVFLDTPGHEAFTAMRARGASVTDFVVLVVAADDGVMDQTREAVNHARAANVPIVVAVNKIDKPEAERDRVVRELSELELIPEDWGGDTLFTFVSAKTGEGVDELLETILLQAEIMELKANPNKTGVGTIVEAKLDKGKGPVATVLVKEGTLKTGDPFVAGVHHGKVRAMTDHEGRIVEKAGPASPVSVQGFSSVPDAGDVFLVVDEEKLARQIGTHRQQKLKEKEVAGVAGPMSLDDALALMQAEESKDLNLIIKGDVQGSVEALKESLLGVTSEEVTVKVIHTGVGTVTESDVMLAAASDAMIIGFNVRPTPKTIYMAEEKNIDLRLYNVIYEAIEDVRKAMEGMLAPVEREEIVGQAEVRQTFGVPKVGTIAGCFITSGKIHRSNSVRLLRDNIMIYEGKIGSMKRFKDDVREVQEGYECGISLQNFNDIKIGDIIEAFTIEQESAKLS